MKSNLDRYENGINPKLKLFNNFNIKHKNQQSFEDQSLKTKA